MIGGPAPIIYQKLGLNPQLDYRSSAIGIMNMTPPESAVIASDIAVKSGNVYLRLRGPFYGNADHHRGYFGCDFRPDGDCGLFQGYPWVRGLQDYKEIGSAAMAQMTKEELLEKIFHDDYEHLKGKKAAHDPRACSWKRSLPCSYHQPDAALYLSKSRPAYRCP